MKRMAKSITESYGEEAAQLLAIYGAQNANPNPLADWILGHTADSDAGVMVAGDGSLVATVREGDDGSWKIEEALDLRAEGTIGYPAEGEWLRALRSIFDGKLILATVRNFTAGREPEAE